MNTGYQPLRQINPRETCGILSFLTFAYTKELFRKGLNGTLQETDIYEITENCSSKKCGDKIEDDWKRSKTVYKLLWNRFGKKYLFYTTIHMTWKLIEGTVQPYSMSRFISYFEQNQTQITKSDAYYYGGSVIFLWFFRCFWIYNYYMLECILGIQIKSALTSLIYRKVLKLRPEKIKGSSLGNIVTILTKDIRTIISAMWPVSDFFIGCAQFLYFSYLLYARIGVVSLIVVVIFLATIISQAILSQFILKMRLKVGKLTDKRLQITREVLAALKIIKMYTWETFFQNRICDARKKETKTNLKAWYLGIIIACLGSLVSKMIFPIFLILYKSLGYAVTIEMLYYLLTIFKELYFVVGVIIPMGWSLRSEIYASILRVEKVLNIEEINEDANQGNDTNDRKNTNCKIEFKNVSVVVRGNTILKDISLSINEPGLYIITGPLGSGKSAIINAILRQYSLEKGHLDVNGIISYASQDAWLFPATIRQNILFGQEFDRSKYNHIIRLCSLEYDLKNLPYGDNTIVTDGGLNLSKGQQARINLARAIYNDSDIYLLDDPLAGLDVKVREEIFNDCIRNYLLNKIVLFVTQNKQHFKWAKQVITLEDGAIKSMLKPDEISISSDNIGDCEALPLDTSQSLSVKDGDQLTNIYHESKSVGEVGFKTYFSYIQYGGLFSFASLIFIFTSAQFTESLSEKYLSEWVDHQQTSNQLMIKNETTFQEDVSQHSKNYTFNLYVIMIGLSSGIDVIKSYIFLAFCRRSSNKFHKMICQSVINCTMPFLDNHFIGNIINRFSYDLDHIDEVFPFLFMDLIKNVLAIGGTLFLIITVKWIFLMAFLVFSVTLLILRRYYIPAARILKRLVAITRSPFIGHLNATIGGLSTIKAFRAEEMLKEEFDKHQDLSITAAYMETTTARAFGFGLDLDCSFFIASVISILLFLDTGTSVGNVGLAITQIFALSGNLQRIIRVWSELEQCMTSVERIVEYSVIQQEIRTDEIKLDKWCSSGKIVFKNVNLTYNSGSEVLKDISFTVNPGEKIVIIGRTGAGKSSIISTLFRLYNYHGIIWIDGVDITTINLQRLRENVSIIPQDPITFEGTVRDNIDPYQRHQDKNIWEALKKVKLDTVIKNLFANIMDLTLTTGQKQLLSIARALLQNNQIVVMDEPTANLDQETDNLVRDLIKVNFADCTIINVAHRLKSAFEADKVMVMENGRILEFDHPKKLLINENSVFYQMMNRIKHDSIYIFLFNLIYLIVIMELRQWRLFRYSR